MDANSPHPSRPAPHSLLDELIEQPGRFSFDAAIAVLLAAAGRRDAGEAIRFQAAPGLAAALRDILAVTPLPDGRFRVSVGFSGLTGPGGVLPRIYTETANGEQRRRSHALAAFLDMLAQRPLSQYAMAGAKYHPHRQIALSRIGPGPDEPPGQQPKQQQQRPGAADGISDPFSAALLAITGHGSPRDVVRSGLTQEQLLYFAGLFAAWPRSADRLSSLLQEWVGAPVRIEQFVGRWQPLPPDQRSALPQAGRAGRYNQLGVDAAIGSRFWDIQSRVRIVIGPVGWADFETLMPSSPRLRQLIRIARAYLDDEATFSVNVALRADAVPPASLGVSRLGWNGWLPMQGQRRQDVHDAVFNAERVEAG